VFNTKVESVEYSDLSAADRGSSGLSGTEIKLRTVQGKTFVFKADEPGEAELEEMVEFIRGQITNQSSPEPDSPSTTSPSSSATRTTSTDDRAELHKTESCVECGESVNEGVSRCPNCGYDPSNIKSKQRKNSLIGGILCATIIGIPLGILYIRRARKQAKKAKRGVTG
jgi:hypothetical protein